MLYRQADFKQMTGQIFRHDRVPLQTAYPRFGFFLMLPFSTIFLYFCVMYNRVLRSVAHVCRDKRQDLGRDHNAGQLQTQTDKPVRHVIRLVQFLSIL
jgi:hypothetical protein